MRDGLGMGKILLRDSNQTCIELGPPGLVGMGWQAPGDFPMGSHPLGADSQRLTG